jgi:hypothetical protein
MNNLKAVEQRGIKTECLQFSTNKLTSSTSNWPTVEQSKEDKTKI